jgi:hypothetical protein
LQGNCKGAAVGGGIEADAKVQAGLGSRFKFCMLVFDPKVAVI